MTGGLELHLNHGDRGMGSALKYSQADVTLRREMVETAAAPTGTAFGCSNRKDHCTARNRVIYFSQKNSWARVILRGAWYSIMLVR